MGKRNALTRTAITATALIGLTACSGGGSGNAELAEFVYQVLTSQEPKTSNIGGVVARTRSNSAEVDQPRHTGTVRHDTGRVEADDGTYVFIDPDGDDNGNGILEDGNGGGVILADTFVAGTYDYVIPMLQQYTTGGVTFLSVGVTGIVTRPEDIPTAGIMTYSGDAEGFVVDNGNFVNLEDGRSFVVANFGNGMVDVTLNDFTPRDDFGNVVPSPIDTIQANDLQINGNTFSGNNVVTSLAGNPVDLIGPGGNHMAAGNFYGIDNGTGGPDEVGGVISNDVDGQSAYLGVFVAD